MGANANSLELCAVPAGRNGMATITASLNGEPLAVEKIDISKSEARATFAKQLGETCPGIDLAELDRQLLKFAAEHASAATPTAKPATNTTGRSNADLLTETPPEIRKAAAEMLADPKLMERIIGDVKALGVAGERELVATGYLCGTSRMQGKPLSLIVQGPSSSGKSYTIEKTTSCFPPEAVLVATQITPQALFYMDPGSLRNKLVIVGERSRLENDDTAEGTRALREMLSAGRLSKLVTMKVNGEMKSVLIEQEGPIAYVESTTLTKIFNEDANRSILVTTDERPEQTKRILQGIAASYSGGAPSANREAIIARHHALQRLLQPYEVVIPFAEDLIGLIHTDRVEARRAVPQLLCMIEASTLLHQGQRKIDADGRLWAEADDYRLARHLLAKPFARQLGGGVSDAAVRFHDRLRGWTDGTFTTKDAAQHERGQHSDRSVRGWLNELHDCGGVDLVEPNHGPKPATWNLLEADFGSLGNGILPSAESLFAENRFRLSG